MYYRLTLTAGIPAPRCGIAIKGDAWVSGWYPAAKWMVPRCYGIDDREKGVLVTKTTRQLLGVFDVFEKTSWLSKPPHSYFLHVGIPRCVTKLFTIEEENMLVAEIKTDRNSFTKIAP